MPRFLEAVAPSGTDLTLLRMSGHEELSRLPEFQLEFTSPKNGIQPADVLGKKIKWSLELAAGKRRDFSGFITRFSEAGEITTAAFGEAPRIGSHRQGKAYRYRASVSPWLWFLTRASHSRIFENVTPAEVVQQIAGSYAGSVRLSLKATYAQRSYIVQYRETDFNFFCRLLEQEGIYFAFEYHDDTQSCVLLDSGGMEGFEVPFGQARGSTDRDCLDLWERTLEIQPHRYALVDFNYWKPRTPWDGDGLVERQHDHATFEMTDYPGSEFDDAIEERGGEDKWVGQYAKARIEELQARFETFSGKGNERRCAPGRIITLKDHDRSDYNDKYLITAAQYAASAGDIASSAATGADFRCSISAINAKTAFRPARSTPKPIISGTQTALVTDWEEPKGQDIAIGRVKVRFHWNKASASCWVRVAQPLAGNGWGFLGLPRPGDEVVVSFQEGNPDRPVVIGCLYNTESKPAWKLPDERAHMGIKSASLGGGGGFNELRFDDTAGKEEIYLRAEHNKTILIQNDRTETVNNQSHLTVKGDVFEEFQAKHHVTVASDRNEEIGGSLSLKVGSDVLAKTSGKFALEAQSEIHLKAGSSLILEADSMLSLKVGGNFITISAAGVAIKGSMVMINSGGAAGTGSGGSPAKPDKPKLAHPSVGGKENKAPATKAANAPGPTAASGAAAAGAAAPAPGPSPQAQMFESAAESGTPFCEVCNCPPS